MIIADEFARYCSRSESTDIRRAFYMGFNAALTAWLEARLNEDKSAWLKLNDEVKACLYFKSVDDSPKEAA